MTDNDSDLPLIGEKDKKYCVLIEVFNTSVYHRTLHLKNQKKNFAAIVYMILVQKKY